MTTLYWHDYETFGADPSRDRPFQFAGIRTDLDLNVVGEPLMVYCQPPADRLPTPMACLVTGITPQQTAAQGLPEREFAARIHQEFSQPGTCVVGYNSIRFDDEVSRYLFYRNFYDPYEREWRNGNSRWDVIDMMRLARALRPEGIAWPNYEDGSPSFRLEDLARANELAHEDAHDALADVMATIEMVKRVKQAQPQLYDYVFNNRHKANVARQLDWLNRKPFLHVSSKLPRENGHVGLMIPLAQHPVNRNAVICFNLLGDSRPLLEWNAEKISEALFTPAAELPEGQQRVPLKAVHLNRCPIVATPKLLDPEAAARLGIDTGLCEQHWLQLRGANIAAKLGRVFSKDFGSRGENPELHLYQSFLPDQDKPLLAQVREASGAELAAATPVFSDGRYGELLLHYRAGNFSDTLTGEERDVWRKICHRQVVQGNDGFLGYGQYREEVSALLKDEEISRQNREILISLQQWGEQLAGNLAVE